VVNAIQSISEGGRLTIKTVTDNSDGQFKLLAVDDNPNALEIIRCTLDAVEYEMLVCESFAAGMDLLMKHSIALIITDLKMPKHSGIDLIRHVNEN
jgi:response regulator RpfG family c-di-GMP phosphodiesterase